MVRGSDIVQLVLRNFFVCLFQCTLILGTGVHRANCPIFYRLRIRLVLFASGTDSISDCLVHTDFIYLYLDRLSRTSVLFRDWLMGHRYDSLLSFSNRFDSIFVYYSRRWNSSICICVSFDEISVEGKPDEERLFTIQ